MLPVKKIPKEYLLNEFASIVGEENLIYKIEDLTLYLLSMSPVATKPLFVILPKNVDEIQKIVLLANKFKAQLYVVSTGKNWGYTDAQASIDNVIIVSLKRMNKVLEINTELGYAVIEPGVTQKQFYDTLENIAPTLSMNVTGSSGDTSIVGNILERGFSVSPHGDRYAHSCNYEIITAVGDKIATGFGNFRAPEVSAVHKWGVGPSIDGLLTQSNFGIITKMTIWLLPKPEKIKIIYFGVKHERDISLLIDKIRKLKLENNVNFSIQIINTLRALSTLEQCPSDESRLSSQKMSELSKKYHLSPWMGYATFSGSDEQINVNLKQFKKKLLKENIFDFYISLTETKIKFLEKILSFLKKINLSPTVLPLYKNAKNAFFLAKGIPISSINKALLWRKKGVINDKQLSLMDPLELDSGLIWISPIVPMTKVHIENVLEILRKYFEKYNFDLMISISTSNDRSLYVVTSIYYNKLDADEVKRANECHDFTVAALIDNGYIPYRGGHNTRKILQKKIDPTYSHFLEEIRGVIDPNQIFVDNLF